MGIDEFLKIREEKKQWLMINGFVNENPLSNGEFKLLEVISKKIDNFIDVGLNKCFFSNKVYEVNPNIKIIGFEPNIFLNKHIKSQKAYQDNHMKLYNCALSDIEGKCDFFINRNYDTMASLSIRQDVMPSFNNCLEKVEVDVKKLDFLKDDLEAKTISMLKLDVEGHEYQVVNGSSSFINEHIDFILFEYSSAWKNTNASFKEIFHLLDSLEFSIYRITPLGVELLRFFYEDMESYTYSNYLAVKDDSILNDLKVYEIEQKYGRSKFYEFEE
jgi:FkbM family methyltransferase